MKQSLLLVVLFALANSLSAQVTLHEETFEGTIGSWSAFDVTGPQAWEPREFDGAMFMQMNGFDGGPMENEDWLISPSIDLEGTTGEELTFQSAANFSGPQLELLISTNHENGENPNDATWTDYTDQATWSNSDFEEVQSGVIDLSGINGSIHIAFKYVSGPDVDAKLWQIDNVLVVGEDGSSTNEIVEQSLISTPVVNGEVLQFDVLDASEEYQFAIYNMAGRVIRTFDQGGMHTTVTVPVATFPNGVYILSVRSGKAIRSFQFVK
ncbi:MAG: choice-of-anchor J domain-containing protein [Bacteroidota bacterium]